MDVESALAVARLVSSLGRIDGRKRVQKIVFLLKSRRVRAFDQQFVLHYYGPFSRELAAQLDFLCQADLVKEERQGDTYTYTPTMDEGERPRVDELSGVREQPKWVARARSLDEKETSFLEALSTLVYLHRRGRRGAQLKREFGESKPRLRQLLPAVEGYAQKHGWI